MSSHPTADRFGSPVAALTKWLQPVPLGQAIALSSLVLTSSSIGLPLPNATATPNPIWYNGLMCDRLATEDSSTVTGTVTYRARMALPPTAVLQVSLLDVSRADAAATVLDTQTIPLQGRQVPIPFTLTYDPTQIDPRFSYAVQARISVNEQLWFINTSRVAVITQGHPTTVEVVLDLVRR